jgi:anti-anti-sigma factor
MRQSGTPRWEVRHMAASQGRVRANRHDDRITFQVEGQGDMRLCPALRRFAEQGLAEGVTAVRIDLRPCTYLDSTFVGTLLRLKRAVARQGPGEFALVAPSPECCRLLHQMGLEQVLPSVAADELPADGWVELPGEAEDVRACQGDMVQAHQELARLDGPAGEPFRWLAGRLEEELGEQGAK